MIETVCEENYNDAKLILGGTMRENKRKLQLSLLIEENFDGIKHRILWLAESAWWLCTWLLSHNNFSGIVAKHFD